MKELYAATTTESVLLIIGASILISGIIIGCAMIRDYRNYLNEHIKARFTLADFFRRERFYLFLFLVRKRLRVYTLPFIVKVLTFAP